MMKEKKRTGEGVVRCIRDELMNRGGGGSKVKRPSWGSPRGLPGGGCCRVLAQPHVSISISHKYYYLNWI